MDKIICSAGMIAKSLMGHDKDKLYVIVNIVNPDFVLIADGKSRTISKPKLKRLRHLKIINFESALKEEQIQKLSDSDIIKLIKENKVR